MGNVVSKRRDLSWNGISILGEKSSIEAMEAKDLLKDCRKLSLKGDCRKLM